MCPSGAGTLLWAEGNSAWSPPCGCSPIQLTMVEQLPFEPYLGLL